MVPTTIILVNLDGICQSNLTPIRARAPSVEYVSMPPYSNAPGTNGTAPAEGQLGPIWTDHGHTMSYDPEGQNQYKLLAVCTYYPFNDLEAREEAHRAQVQKKGPLFDDSKMSDPDRLINEKPC